MIINFSENLKKLRQVKGITQEDLCEKLNFKYKTKINKGMISRWESSKEYPSLKNIACISDFFSIKIDELIR